MSATPVPSTPWANDRDEDELVPVPAPVAAPKKKRGCRGGRGKGPKPESSAELRPESTGRQPRREPRAESSAEPRAEQPRKDRRRPEPRQHQSTAEDLHVLLATDPGDLSPVQRAELLSILQTALGDASNKVLQAVGKTLFPDVKACFDVASSSSAAPAPAPARTPLEDAEAFVRKARWWKSDPTETQRNQIVSALALVRKARDSALFDQVKVHFGGMSLEHSAFLKQLKKALPVVNCQYANTVCKGVRAFLKGLEARSAVVELLCKEGLGAARTQHDALQARRNALKEPAKEPANVEPSQDEPTEEDPKTDSDEEPTEEEVPDATTSVE